MLYLNNYSQLPLAAESNNNLLEVGIDKYFIISIVSGCSKQAYKCVLDDEIPSLPFII